MENLGYLVIAYSIIFAAIFLYVAFLWRRQARLNDEVRAIELKLNELRAELSRIETTPNSSAGH
ncbi:MAG TPA: CcmD family protein [Candidatus Binataceae bacterium]|nr:CcmD family protein [Candidatus Binataceae bacterium]